MYAVPVESFPRMWDQLIKRLKEMETSRIIPTYVGSTFSISKHHIAAYESFPRMWDQLVEDYHVLIGCRIIPTYVGSTMHHPSVILQCANHSHVCGINGRIRNMHHLQCRIIPTYVGSTSVNQPHGRYVSNHSHVCGINGIQDIQESKNIESFPRMWDQPQKEREEKAADRIIPTYVGSTHGKYIRLILRTNHSHVCGINS